MELCATIKPRADGTVIVNIPLGRNETRKYVFSGDPLACEVEDESHAALMQATNNFLTREDYEKEMAYRREQRERRERQKAQAQRLQALQSAAGTGGSFVPPLGADDGDSFDDADDLDEERQTNAQTNAQPQEAGTRPTGRVRRAQKA